MATQRVWLITGASSGIGKCMTVIALERGDIVVATLRRPENLDDLKSKFPPDQLHILKLDVTNPKEISDTFATVKETVGRLDIVFNNAGIGLIAEVESTPDDIARLIFETNFWGAANVNREAVAFFRDVNPPGVGGRLLTISSVGGLIPIADIGYYVASKHAIEGLTETLALELDPAWNIKVSLIETGWLRTEITHLRDKGGNAWILPPHPAYSDPSLYAAQTRAALIAAFDGRESPLHIGDAQKATLKMYDFALLPDPPLHFILGKDSVQATGGQLQKVTQDLEAYKSWSQDLD